MEQNSIKFVGTNEKLFSRTLIDHIDGRQTLIVPETHNAILVKDGQMLQTLSSGKYLLSDFVDLKAEPDASIEVLFMSKTAKLKLLWGTPQKIDFYDGVLEEDYKVGMSGDFDVQIGDPRKSYLYLVGAAEDLTADALQERLQSTFHCKEKHCAKGFKKPKSQTFKRIWHFGFFFQYCKHYY